MINNMNNLVKDSLKDERINEIIEEFQKKFNLELSEFEKKLFELSYRMGFLDGVKVMNKD
jgi:hypothetical protein